MGPFIFNSMTDFLTASKIRSPYSANPTTFENWYKPPNAMTTSTGKEWRNVSLAVEKTPGHSHLQYAMYYGSPTSPTFPYTTTADLPHPTNQPASTPPTSMTPGPQWKVETGRNTLSS